MLDGVRAPQGEQAVSLPHSFEVRVANVGEATKASDYEFEVLVIVAPNQKQPPLGSDWVSAAAPENVDFVVLSRKAVLANDFKGIPLSNDERGLFVKEVGYALMTAYANPGTYTSSLQP